MHIVPSALRCFWIDHRTVLQARMRFRANAEAENFMSKPETKTHGASSPDVGAASSSMDPSLSEVPVICLARATWRYQKRRPAANSGERPSSRMLERQFRAASGRSGGGWHGR